MNSVNKVILIGNVGKDPDVRYLEGNVPVCRFPLATCESYRNRSGENVTQTEWHNIVLWRGLAEIAQKFVKKGTPLYIEGRISTRSFDDKDGNKRYVTEIVASNMILLGRKPDQQAGEEGKMAGGLEPGEPSVPEGPSPQPQDDDLPF
jgi:single-strand DNA-binding protein